MIDGIKFFIENKEGFEKHIEATNIVHLMVQTIPKIKKVFDRKTTLYNGLRIAITDNRAWIRGSIHKYYNNIVNNGNHNYNDFSYSDFQFALQNLEEAFNFNKHNTNVVKLEFGINVETELNPKLLIEESVVLYDYKSPTVQEGFKGSGKYLKYQFTDYSIKVYDKSGQNRLTTKHILRIELEITGSRYLKKHFGVKTLSDINRRSLKLIFDKFLYHYDKLLILDSTMIAQSLRSDEIVLFQNGINAKYWYNIRKQKDYKELIRFKADFNKVLKTYDLLNTKNKIKKQLKAKFKELIKEKIDSNENLILK